MRLTIRILGLELLDIDLSTDARDDEDKARDLSGGSLSSDAHEVADTDHFMGFTNGRSCE